MADGTDPKGTPLAAMDRSAWERAVFPALRALIRLRYFSYEVEGIEHVPQDGSVVYVQNHSGWFPLDAFFVNMAIANAHGAARIPFYATHDTALAAPVLGPVLRRLGGIPASAFRRPERLAPAYHSFGIFPEGEAGNTKPCWEAYRMRKWQRGFVQLAAARDAVVVPAAVFGGEECLPVAWTLEAIEPLIGSVLGIPLSPFPLPSRWRVVFHPPVRVPARPNGPAGRELAARLQETVQATLDRDARGYPLGRISSLLARSAQVRDVARASGLSELAEWRARARELVEGTSLKAVAERARALLGTT